MSWYDNREMCKSCKGTCIDKNGENCFECGSSGYTLKKGADMNLKEEVQNAAKAAGITEVTKMAKHCDLSYERTSRVWNGIETAKFADVRQVLHSIGHHLEVINSIKTGKKS